MTAVSKYRGEDANLPAQVSRQFSNLLKVAEEEATSVASVSQAKAQRMLAFLDLCTEQGMGDKEFIQCVKQGLELALDRGDPTAYKGILQIWQKLIYEVKFQMGQVIGQSSVAITQVMQNKQVNVNSPSTEDMEMAALEEEIARREAIEDSDGVSEAEIIDS